MPTMAPRSSCVAARTVAALAALGLTRRSLHVNPFRRDLDDHPRLPRSETLEPIPGVRARQLFDVLIRALGDELGPTADRERVLIWMRGIDDGDRDAVVAQEVAGLDPMKRRVEVNEGAVGFDPDDGRLRAAVRIHRGHGREVAAVEDPNLTRSQLDHLDIVPGHG